MNKPKASTRIRKPKILFCYECGNKLRGPFGVTAILKVDKLPRNLHKTCLKDNEFDYIDSKAKGK